MFINSSNLTIFVDKNPNTVAFLDSLSYPFLFTYSESKQTNILSKLNAPSRGQYSFGRGDVKSSRGVFVTYYFALREK